MKSIELTTMGKTFRQLREAKNFKREFIADECGVGYDAIAKMEQGNADVGLGKFIIYLKVVGIGLGEFVKQYEKNLPPEDDSNISQVSDTGGSVYNRRNKMR